MNKNRICIWLDNPTNRSDDHVNIRDDLRPIFHSFRIFTNPNECVDFIINSTNAKILFVTSDTFVDQILPIFHSFEQIDSIYIFSLNNVINSRWENDYEKIKEISNDMKFLCNQIKEEMTQSRNDSISFISSTDVQSSNINRQDPSFMYSQLLKDIILNDRQYEQEEQTRTDMLIYCRKVYATSQPTLAILDEFEQYYIPELSIYWYTRECFLYKMLNKALWTPQPDVLYKLRYILRHLHKQIVSQATLQRRNLSKMIVYRGQNMSPDQFEKIQKNIGGFLSFNNFLSTSIKPDVALNFHWGAEIAVLFKIHVDPSIEKFPFANIEHLSYQQGQDAEQEFLFSMGTVFRILQIDKRDESYHVQLILSADNDEQLAEYTKHTRVNTRSPHSFVSLLKLMHVLAQYSSVDQFAEMLRDDGSSTENATVIGSIHHAFGSIYNERGLPKQALDHFHQSLSEYLTMMRADHPQLSPTYNNIGSAHAKQFDYETALTFHQLALECQLNSDTPDISSVVVYTNNIAGVYLRQGDSTKALEYHQRALTLQKQHLGEDDPSLTSTYNIISAIYYRLHDYEQATFYHEKAVALQETTARSDPTASANCSNTAGAVCLSQGQYQEALVHFHQALKIQQQYLLPNNPSLIVPYNCIGNTYYKQTQYEDALCYHKKALAIEKTSLSDSHVSIATSYENISKDYVGLSRWTDALENGLKAIEETKQSLRTDPSTLASLLTHVGYIYKQQNNYPEALNYFHRTVEIQHQYLSSDHSLLASTYDHIASIYSEQGKIEEALVYYKETLEIEGRSLLQNHPSIIASYVNISKTYATLLHWSDALEYSLKAVEHMKQSSQTDVTTLAALMQFVGYAYHQQNEYQEAINYYQKAIKLYHSFLPEEDASLIAIAFYKKVLRIELKTLPDNAKTIADTYSSLSTAYSSLNRFDEALITGDQALNQLLKTLPYDHSEVVQQQNYLNTIKIHQMLTEEHH